MEIIFLIASFFNIGIALLVWKRHIDERSGKIFGLFAFSTGVWVFSNFILRVYPSQIITLQITYALGGAVALLGFAWVRAFLRKPLPKYVFLPAAIITAFFSFASFIPDLVVMAANKVTLLGYEGKFGILFPFYAAYNSLLTMFILIELFSALRRSKGLKRAQISYIFSGALIFAGVAATVSLLAPLAVNSFRFTGLSSLASIFFVALIFYAILKHHLMNVRVIATELFSALILILAFLDVLFSETPTEFITRFGVFVLIAIFSILLIRGTLREIHELERLSEEKSTFVSIASHQLRSPLTAIKGFLSMIREGSGDEKTRADWLGKAYLSNERLIRLVSDLLNISRIERGKIQYNFKYISILKLLNSVIEELSAQGKKDGVELRYEKPDTPPPAVRADAEKLRQVFTNLIDNALKYTNEGWVLVKVSHLRDFKKIRIVIKDTGIGISKDDLEKLFGRFSRGEGGQRAVAEGTGLGLYVAREIIKAHQGKIWAESDGEGRGSNFVVELPIT